MIAGLSIPLYCFNWSLIRLLTYVPLSGFHDKSPLHVEDHVFAVLIALEFVILLLKFNPTEIRSKITMVSALQYTPVDKIEGVSPTA